MDGIGLECRGWESRGYIIHNEGMYMMIEEKENSVSTASLKDLKFDMEFIFDIHGDDMDRDELKKRILGIIESLK